MSLYEQVYIITNIIYIFAIYKLFHVFFDKTACDNKIKIITLSMYFIALSAGIFITRIPIITLLINLVFLFITSFSYKSSLQKKLIATSCIYSLILIIELTTQVFFGFVELSGMKDSTVNSISILIFLRVIILIIAYLMSRYRNSFKKDHNIPKIYYSAFSVVLFGTLYLFISLLENENITINHIIVNATVLIIVNITMIIIDEKIYNAIISENEKNILKQQNSAYENQTEIINQSTEAIKILKHDFKNHLIMLSNLYLNSKSEEIEPYINNLLGTIENELFSNSNNFVIDSIINFKLRNLENTGMKIYVDVSVPQTVNIMAYDLTTILANLLDNAIISSKKSEQKIIDIKISSKMDNLIILIDNSYDGNIIVENGKFKTTKHFKSNHGLGIMSVEKVLMKYDGEITTEHTSNIFFTSVIIPY